MNTAELPGSSRSTSAQRALAVMRLSARKTLEPLLKPATQDAVLAVETDLSQSSAVKSSARNLLVGFQAFSDAFFAALDREMDSAVDDLFNVAENPAQPARARGRGLALVDYAQMEEQTVAIRVATRVRNAADLEYASLTRRIARVVRIPGVGERDNPFHPLRYCRALGQAVEKLGFQGDERHTMLKAFELPLQKPLIEVYEALNRKLEARGVTDEEAARFSSVPPRRAGPGAARACVPEAAEAPSKPDAAPVAASPTAVDGARADGGDASAADAAPVASLPSGTPMGTTASQLLTALYQRLHSKRQGVAGSAVPAVPSPAGTPDAPDLLGPDTRGFAGIPPAPLLPSSSARAEAAAGSGPVTGPAAFSAIEPGLLASINEVQRLNALAAMTGRNSAARALLSRDEQHQRQQVADRATRQIDKLTIDLVGMVFDRIHQDDAIPAPVRIALSRLQFPVMKVALADADLFVSPSQPARRLMDRIASTAIGWRSEGEEGARYLAEVNKAINTVLLAINEGPGIFETALGDFERFLAEERGRDDEPAERARQALEEAEKREAMVANATAGMRRAFEGVELEPYLREFLLDVWVRVVVAATLREAAEPDFARRYRDAASDLIWSVQPKIEADDRKRLVKTIPSVLNTLREGLQLIDVPFSRMRPFFTQLMESHAQAVKAGEAAAPGAAAVDAMSIRSRIDAFPLEAPRLADGQEPYELAAQMLREAVAANGADVNLLEEPADAGSDETVAAGPLSDDEIDATIEGWQRGSWFDLWTGEATERVRLRWVSPRRHFYLFTSAEDGRAHSIAPAILRGYVRAGRITPAEKAPLFQRVVDHLLRDLQPEDAALAV